MSMHVITSIEMRHGTSILQRVREFLNMCEGSIVIRVFRDGKRILRKEGEKMVKCPYCGYEGEHVLLKTWRYRWWTVYFYQCSKCGKKFRYQVDPEGKRKSYVMRVGVKRKQKS